MSDTLVHKEIINDLFKWRSHIDVGPVGLISHNDVGLIRPTFQKL